jgi:hypothetical protein
MTSALRPRDRAAYLGLCLTYLDTALDYAKKAGAPSVVKRLQLARRSAYGAKRNAGYRVTRAQEGG